MEIAIKTTNLTKRYGDKAAVSSVSMTVGRGDIYGFIGSNGAGKTTFIRCLMGLITPTEGSIQLLGASGGKQLVESRKKIGCIVETPALLQNMCAFDCISAHALLYGKKNRAKMEELLHLVGLSDTGTKKVKNFSLGMKQRMAIAQALVNDPEVLILDEPTNGMDPQGIVEMRHLLTKLAKEKSLTILISSHILSELEQLATRFGIIKDGALVDEFPRTMLTQRGVTLESYFISKVVTL